MSGHAAIHLAVKLDNIKYCSTNQQLPSRNREKNDYTETITSNLHLIDHLLFSHKHLIAASILPQLRSSV
jgi:hypothetical protein